MIINKYNTYYKIKIPNYFLNYQSKEKIEKLTKKILFKINKIDKDNHINIKLNIYIDSNYGTIIYLYNKKKKKIINRIIKIKIEKNANLLYKIDYFKIDKEICKNIYYYNNYFYIKIKNDINKSKHDKYLFLLDNSKIIIDSKNVIANKGIKI